MDGATIQYIYNTGLKAFLRGGNNYNTRAVAAEGYGYKWKITETGEGTYSLTDSCEYNNAGKLTNQWIKMFADGATGIYVDNNNGANCDAWSITVAADGTFTIANEVAAAGCVFGGVAGDIGVSKENSGSIPGTYLNLYVPETDNFHYTWYAVSTTDFETYRTAFLAFDEQRSIYQAAMALYAKLQDADAAGVTGLDAYVTVYNNAAASIEDLNAATKAVEKAITDAASGTATADNPADLTMKIVEADMSGNSAWAYGTGSVAKVALGNGIGELYGGYGQYDPYDAYQTIEGLQPGVYAFGAQGFHRTDYYQDKYLAGSTENFAVLYGTDVATTDTETSPLHNIMHGLAPNNKLGVGNEVEAKMDGETYYVPDNLAAAAAYLESGLYKGNEVFFYVSGESALIGIRNMNKIMYNWTCFDNLTLKYYGNAADALRLLLDKYLAKVPVYDEDELITVSVLEAYNGALTDAQTAELASYEDVKAVKAVVEAAEAAILANKEAWAQYEFQYKEAEKASTNPAYEGSAMDDLSDLVMDAEDVMGEKELTTEEVLAAAEQLKNDIADAIANAIAPGTEYDQLKNTDFSQGADHWTWESNNDGAGSSGSAFTHNTTAKCAEAWSVKSFDLYQTIENAPVGMYTISAQGFGRVGRGQNAWLGYYNEDGTKKDQFKQLDAWVYMNDNKTQLPSVFEYPTLYTEDEEGNANHRYALAGYTDVYNDPNVAVGTSESGYVYPDGMTSAGVAFAEGDYTFETFGLVAKKGDALRVGMKGSSEHATDADSWAIFTNFKLTFWGKQTDKVAPALLKAINDIDLTAAMGADVKANATELKTQGEAAYNATPQDGETMFDALAAILAYTETIETSKKVFAQLVNDLDVFGLYIPEASNTALQDEALIYYETVYAEYATYTDAQATEAIAKIAEYTTKLSYPAEYTEASDENPVDFTGVLKTPGFDKEGVNSMEGWTKVSGTHNFGNDDTQKSALALEFYHNVFNLKQTVVVPNGTYMVVARGFARNSGGALADYNLWMAGTPSATELYAYSVEGDSVKASFEHQASLPNAQLGSEFGGTTFVTPDTEDTYYVPNSMTDFRAFLDGVGADIYNNYVIVKVTNGSLTLGVQCAAKNEWVIMDDFQLFYYGAESAKEEAGWTTDINGIENAAPAKVEYFNVQGVKADKMAKGLNIIRITDVNGNVQVKKVVK